MFFLLLIVQIVNTNCTNSKICKKLFIQKSYIMGKIQSTKTLDLAKENPPNCFPMFLNNTNF